MRKNNFKNRHFVGKQIRASHVFCIDANNNNLGILPISKALSIANSSGLELVQINSNGKHPTCKVLDYGKFKYDQSKKEKLARKKQRESTIKIKEIKFRPSTDDNDLKIKAKQAQKFLADGHKVKVSINFRDREMRHREIGTETFNQFLAQIPNAQVEGKPDMNGKTMSIMLSKT